jgi:hypothetical protein
MLIDQSEIGSLAMETTVLVDAFEGTLKELGLKDRNDPAWLVAAKQIISFAKEGERDVTRLRDLTLIAMYRLKQTTSPIYEYHPSASIC